MPSLVTLIRHRRHYKGHGHAFPNLGKWMVGLMTFLGLSLLAGLFLVGLMYADIVKDLPPVGNIEYLYGNTAKGFLEPVQVYDHVGKKMFDLLHPLSADRRWMRVSGSGSDVLPQNVLDAVVASQDESFWSNQGHDLVSLIFALLHGEWKDPEFQFPRTITQQLVAMTILPAGDFSRSPLRQYFREAVLAQRLTERFSKEQILEWYLNSVGFGPLATGVDAAALVYFGRHSSDLSMAEGAYLAAMIKEFSKQPISESDTLLEGQEQILQLMDRNGLISEAQYLSAKLESLALRQPPSSRDWSLQSYVWNRLFKVLGSDVLHRSNLHVFTTIDSELQIQVECTVEIYLDKGKVQSLGFENLASDAEDCIAAAMLPISTRGQAGKDDKEVDVAAVVMDPQSGEILSYYGSAELPAPSGAILYPFIYLTSFSQGNSPGSMVLDLPLEPMDGKEEVSLEGLQAHGPVRMRTALIGAYPLAARRTILSSGLDAVLYVIRQMGVVNVQLEKEEFFETDSVEKSEVSLIDTVYGYGVIANEGKMVGVSSENHQQGDGWRELDPVLIKLVREDSGKVLCEPFTTERSILSQQLAYLVTHVLKDDAERWSVFGSTNALDLSFPSAVMIGTSGREDVSWTIGYTPTRVAGVWLGNITSEEAEGEGKFIDALPLWEVLMEYETKALPSKGWNEPPGVISMEVCDPSGLLPTEYCPNVVKEIFLEGTEPIYYDTFYRPIRVNKDTGKLATIFTPLNNIEEYVFMLPPPEARYWAQGEGLLLPPTEYDRLQTTSLTHRDVGIESPKSFEYIKGVKWISGWMNIEEFFFFRLQYGVGLNPTHWVQIGDDHYEPVTQDVLALWDTRSLDGLYTLQLIVVDQDGIAQIATQYVTVDNEIPEIQVLGPNQGEKFHLTHDQSFTFEVSASDNIGISKVELYLDGKNVETKFESPFAVQIPVLQIGRIELYAKATDLVGNVTESDIVSISIVE